MAALPGRKALVRVTGAAVAFADEATTGDGGHVEYTITAAAKRCWDPTQPITVKVDGAAVTAGFTIERLVGRITFGESQDDGVVTVSGKYLPLATAAGCHEFTVDRECALIAVPEFGDEWKQNLAGMLGISGTLSRWYQSDAYFAGAMDSTSPIVLELFADRDAAFTYRVWAAITKDALSGSVDSAVDEAVEWTGTADIDGNVVATR